MPTPKLIFLGTGGAFTDFRKNYHNNAVIPVSDGKYVLLDCGATAVQSLKELGIHPWDVAGVIITHLHGDHIGGLEQLIWERFYTGPNGNPGWLKTSIATTPDLLASLRQILSPCIDEYTDSRGVVHPGGYDALVKEKEMTPKIMKWVVGGVAFCLYPTNHVVSADGSVNKEAYGVFVRDEYGLDGFYYTSDTLFNEKIGEEHPDGLIFHDCTFSPRYPGTVHTHYEELLTLPAEVRARIVLMHHTEVPGTVPFPTTVGFYGVATRHSQW